MSVTSTGQPDTLTARVAEEIRAIMGRRRISGAELARRLGVSPMWVSDRLRGVTPIDLTDLERIAEIFGVPARVLLPGTGETSPRYLARRQPINVRPPVRSDPWDRPAGRPRDVRRLALLAA